MHVRLDKFLCLTYVNQSHLLVGSVFKNVSFGFTHFTLYVLYLRFYGCEKTHDHSSSYHREHLIGADLQFHSLVHYHHGGECVGM